MAEKLENVEFSDLFSEAHRWDVASFNVRFRRMLAGTVRVGTECYQYGGIGMESVGPKLTVVPTKKLLIVLRDNMRTIPYDEVYFELIHYSNGTSGVFAKYNVVAGNLLIAYVPTSSIPYVEVRPTTVVSDT